MKYIIILTSLLFLGCEDSPEQKKWDNTTHTCIIMDTYPVKASQKTFVKCLDNEGIYKIYGYLGHNGDTIQIAGNKLTKFKKQN